MDFQSVVANRARIEGQLVMVDEFLNHKVDPDVMRGVGSALADFVKPWNVDLILTAEASGIPPALACGLHADLPVVYAKKYVGPGQRYTFGREVASPTKGTEYRVEVSRRVLEPGLRIAIVDDFLSGGRTAEALGEIAVEAGCQPIGFAFAIEKSFTPGRKRLEAHGWTVKSLVKVESIEDGVVTFGTTDV
ncbi:MAG: xanthine phosphoribosyltransferase [Acidimicrobiia bacterium]|nr:xanthine phosphoribosyltransferase [Acidimicrobiia bacterium]